MAQLTKEELEQLVKDGKMSFINIIYYFYSIDALQNRTEGIKAPQWLTQQQQKWIQEAMKILKNASNNEE